MAFHILPSMRAKTEGEKVNRPESAWGHGRTDLLLGQKGRKAEEVWGRESRKVRLSP